MHYDFKLLAIRPRPGCDPKFRKLLKEGEIYRFYSDYTFHPEPLPDGAFHEVERITHQPPVPDNLYKQGELAVNISAIVGKNGSGKSTLMELLYYAVYVLGCGSTGRNNKTILEPRHEQLLSYQRKLQSEKVELFEKSRKYCQNLLEASSASEPIFPHYRDLSKCLQERRENQHGRKSTLPKIKREEQNHQAILEGLKVSIFYQWRGHNFELRIDDRIDFMETPEDLSNAIYKDLDRNMTIFGLLTDQPWKPIPADLSEQLLDQFFYTVAVNYSHHALNSLHLGNWLTAVFHKNDAYQTPLVINPMRTKGRFDINDENDFARYRLLYNLIVEFRKPDTPKKLKVTDQQWVEKVRFSYDPRKEGNVFLRSDHAVKSEGQTKVDQDAIHLFEDLQQVFYKQDPRTKLELWASMLPFQRKLNSYLVRKVQKIMQSYSLYRGGYQFGKAGNPDNIRFLETLRDEASHITFKLWQTISFIRTCLTYSTEDKANPWDYGGGDPSEKHPPVFEFELHELDTWLQDNREDPLDLMNYLPPPIFTIEYILSGTPDVNGESPTLSGLSSGEQQLIHTTQNVVYHLNNLRSAWIRDRQQQSDKDRNSTESSPQAYQAVNIMIDEIELYFHPEYQRQFVSRLLQAIDRLKLGTRGEQEGDIRAVNILLSTHSPFILSDVPAAQVLHLEKGKIVPVAQRSFAANIHDLLAHKFFLEDGFMGAWATGIIEKVIRILRVKMLQDQLQTLQRPEHSDQRKVLQQEIKALQALGVLEKAHPDEVLAVIHLVGETVVREKLKDMHREAFARELGEMWDRDARQAAIREVERLIRDHDLDRDELKRGTP